MDSASNHGRLHGLDGIRAVSILLVIAFHCSETAGFPNTGPLDVFVRNGGFGVDIFFVLSGFLITHLLLKEEQRAGSFNLPAFYGRRALRILPPALFCLLVMLLLSRLSLAGITMKDVLTATFSLRNYSGGPWETGHFWSLSTEEQFYFLWPLFLLRAPRRWCAPLVAMAILAAPGWRYVAYKMNTVQNPFRFDLHFDALLVGCLLALLRSQPRTLAILRKPLLQSSIVPVAGVALFVALNLLPLIGPVYVLKETILLVAVAAFVSYSVDCPNTALGRILNWPPVVWCGVLSYSLYLWQQLFCKSTMPHALGLTQTFPLNILVTFCAAALSYCAIEKPIAALRQRMTVRSGPAGRRALILKTISGHICRYSEER